MVDPRLADECVSHDGLHHLYDGSHSCFYCGATGNALNARFPQTNTEPCYCKRCKGILPAPCRYRSEAKARGEWSWKRIWCWADGHGGIAWDGNPASNAGRPWCKRCGARVKLV